MTADLGFKNQVLQALGDGLWQIDLDQESIAWDQGCQRLAEESGHADSLTLSAWYLLIHPQDQAELEACIRSLKKHRPRMDVECRLRTSGDGWRWVHLRGVVSHWRGDIAQKVSGLLMDIDTRKQAELATQHKLQQATRLMQSMPDLLMVVDASGHIRRLHHPGAHLPLPTNPATYLGRSVEQALPPALFTPIIEALGKVVGTLAPTHFLADLSRPGQDFWTEGSVTPVGGKAAFHGDFLITLRDVTLRMKREQALEELALTDALTGLPNRRHFLERLDAAFADHQRYGRPGALLMMDLDHFKHINDRWGHATGDELLVAFAHACRGAVRRMDVIGRVGGEEFAVLLPEADHQGAMEMAERIRHAMARLCIQAEETPISTTVSIGLTVFDRRAGNIDNLLARADRSLYTAKAQGRNRVSPCPMFSYGIADPTESERE